MRQDAAISQKALQFSKSTMRRGSLCLSPSRLSVRGGVENINARADRADCSCVQAPSCRSASAWIKKGGNLRGRIDGMRESLPTVRTKETWHGQF